MSTKKNNGRVNLTKQLVDIASNFMLELKILSKGSLASMKVLLFVTILIALTPLLTLEGQLQGQIRNEHAFNRNYSNPHFGIEMQYPSDWVKLDLSGNRSSYLLVTFGSPIGGPVGSLNIIAENGASNLTYSGFIAENIKNLKQSGKIQDLNYSSPSSLAGHPAHKIVYTTISPRGISFKTLQIFSLVGNTAYFITYAAPSEYYSFHLPTIQTMINSIRLNK